MKLRVLIRLRPSILDVQGAAVKRALGGLGFEALHDLRVGKMIELDVGASSPEAARARVDEMCRKLLANPLLEEYTIEVLARDDLAEARVGG